MFRVLLILLTTLVLISCLRTEEDKVVQHTPFLNVDDSSANALIQHMTLEEKIGQLIVLKSDLKNDSLRDSIYQWSRQGIFGGVLLQDLKLADYIKVIDTLNMLSKEPLLNGTNQLVVLNNQFSDAVPFPLAPSIGSIHNDTLQRELEALYLEQCKILGINFCFTPSTNRIKSDTKKYPFQVFENNTKRQLERAKRVLHNLKGEQILSFGNTFSDFYPMENDTTGFLDSILAHPSYLTQNGLSGFLVDESIFEMDSIQKYQTFFLKNYLKEEMDFDGLLVGEITTQATIDELIHSGTDLFVVRDSAKALFDYLHAFVKQGLLPESVINEKVYKILLAKSYAAGTAKPPKIDTVRAEIVIQNDQFKYYGRQLFEQSIILANNHDNLLPYSKTYRRDFRIINVGESRLEVFKDYFSKYANYQNFNHPPNKDGNIKPLKTIYHKHSTSVIVLDNVNLDSIQHKKFIQSINDLSKSAKVSIVNFGNPLNFQFFASAVTMIQVFEKNKTTESLVPQLLFGGMSAKGKLPLTMNEQLTYGKYIPTPITRLKYTVPQEVGIAPENLVGINAIIESAIGKKATPGAQILVIKDGKVFYNKSFGFHTYDKKQAIRNSDLYDIASITKIASTSIAAMKLYEENKFKLTDKISKKLDLHKNARIGRLTFKELFTHASGLQANMPISKYYIKSDTVVGNCSQYYCKEANLDYTVQIANDMYMNKRWQDSLWKKIDRLKIKRRGRYKYSDVNFNLIQRFIEKDTKQPLDDYLNTNFYNSLNLRRTAFRPREKFKPIHLVPTENDDRWRQQVLRGFVHDESAGLLGGVAGNSGLFSNANDLAVIFQMLLNGGDYGNQKYINPKTIKEFTTAKYGNHRGLGFVVKGSRGANSLSKKASKKTYGHTGFTGTCVWVDPESDLIFIFLSNRIHPSKSNTKLYRSQVRRRIHDVIYNAMDTYKGGEIRSEKILVDL